ncbi:hypothetical protein M5K25_015706 [Dendrobium thyrsiflorum]|uniref:Uncharacterized protein n=1 Tax=Dendrobium thyrsiflorum TaxID=117978 RepID=A0ABD0URR9_DENTH
MSSGSCSYWDATSASWCYPQRRWTKLVPTISFIQKIQEDETVGDYLDRILYRLTLSVEEQICHRQCLIVTRRPPPPESATDPLKKNLCFLFFVLISCLLREINRFIAINPQIAVQKNSSSRNSISPPAAAPLLQTGSRSLSRENSVTRDDCQLGKTFYVPPPSPKPGFENSETHREALHVGSIQFSMRCQRMTSKEKERPYQVARKPINSFMTEREHLDEESGNGGAAGEASVLPLVGHLLKKGIPAYFPGAGPAERYLRGARNSRALQWRRRNLDQRGIG